MRIKMFAIVALIVSAMAITAPAQTQTHASTVDAPINGPLVIEGATPSKPGNPSLYVVSSGTSPRSLGFASHGLGYGSVYSGAPSPRGRFIALAEGLGGLWIINADGSSPYRLVGGNPNHGPAIDVTEAAWSPDRYTIAYTRDTRNMGCGCSTPTVDTMPGDGLWIVRYDGTTRPQLIMSGTVMGLKGPFQLLSWTPDGAAVFANTPRGLEEIAIPSGARRVIVPHVSGVVSPDGTLLAAVSHPARYDPHFVSTFSIRTIATGSTTVLARTTASLNYLHWSPDGQFLAYTKVSSLNFPNDPVEVHVINVSSGAVSTVYRQSHYDPIGVVAWLPNPQ